MSEIRLNFLNVEPQLRNISRGFSGSVVLTNPGHNSNLISVTNKFETLETMKTDLDAYHSVLASEMENCLRHVRTIIQQDTEIASRLSG